MKVQHFISAVFVTALWGLNGVISKIGLTEFPPLFYAALRFTTLFPLIFVVAKPDVQWRYIVIIGFVWGILQFSFLNLALYLGISVGISSLLLQSSVFFAMIFSSLILKEHPHIYQVLGMCLGLGGIVILGFDADENATFAGFMLSIAAAMSWGLGNVMIKKAHTDDAFGLMVWVSAIPVLPLLAFSFFEEKQEILNALSDHVPWKGLACAIYAGFISALLGGTLWLRLFKSYSVNRVTAFGLLVPLFGIAFGALFLGERISMRSIAAGGLIILGLLLSQLLSSRKKVSKVDDDAQAQDQYEKIVMPI